MAELQLSDSINIKFYFMFYKYLYNIECPLFICVALCFQFIVITLALPHCDLDETYNF